MSRGYQHNFSASSPYVFEKENRERKARTMAAVLEDCLPRPLSGLDLLNVGGSAGIIDNFLAGHFRSVVGIDIDAPAIEYANSHFSRDNLEFRVADAMSLPYDDDSFDVVICSHVYEHVPDPRRMFSEIHRVLRDGGVCYFSAGNRIMWNEPHYNLPLLSVIPRPLAHVYIRLAGKASHYHEKHLSYWGLKSLVSRFSCRDYTVQLVEQPEKFHTDYMISPGSFKAQLARTLLRLAYWAFPGYIWVLVKHSGR